MKSFSIQILACDKPFYVGDCESVIVPTNDGLVGIWADHSNVIMAIVPGELIYRIPGGADQKAIVSNGMIKIEDNEVLILVDTIERPEEIDIHRAQRAADRAKEEMLQKKSLREYRLAEANLARALNRLKVKNHRQ